MTRFLLFTFLLAASVVGQAQTDFERYFNNNTLRIDFSLSGTATQTQVALEQLKQEPNWGGPRQNLADQRNYGNYRYQAFDHKSGKLIYSKGFSSLFQEWQSTDEAKRLHRSYYHVATLPFPKDSIDFSLDWRNERGEFETLFRIAINPVDYFILKETAPAYPVKTMAEYGTSDKKVDLVFLPEGYTANEMDKFEADIKRLTDYLFTIPPYNTHREDFNLHAVLVPSVESGTDIPGQGVYKQTAFNSTFYTFDAERYLTTRDMKSVYDAMAGVPCDQVYVLVNTPKYGGGGFYNFLNLCSADHAKSPEVFVHEFGHGFVGLADEYFANGVSDEYYKLTIEPWEPNITTHVDFERKWKSMIAPGTPIPTPRTDQYNGVVGLFEGGGYTTKGVYSPVTDCRMRTNEAPGYCPVCSKAIDETIRLLTE